MEKTCPRPVAMRKETLESVHYVLKGERLLKRAGIRIDVIPVPPGDQLRLGDGTEVLLPGSEAGGGSARRE